MISNVHKAFRGLSAVISSLWSLKITEIKRILYLSERYPRKQTNIIKKKKKYQLQIHSSTQTIFQGKKYIPRERQLCE